MNFCIQRPKAIFDKIAIIIVAITVIFWIASILFSSYYLRSTIENEFTNSNIKTLQSVAKQSIDDLRFSDFYQLRRMLYGFYDASYMDYFALYTVDMKPFATYPATQFSSSDISSIEEQIKNNASEERTQIFFNSSGHRRFHFQQQVKDENGNVLGYIFMGGKTAWLDKMVSKQVFYFVFLGFAALLIEVGILVYFARRFTRPITQLTNTLKIVQEKSPEELIPTVLAQPHLENTCSEVELFDSVVRKLLERIKEYQQKEMDLSIQATLGRLASHFAHDIKTPLSTLKSYLSSHKPADGASEAELAKFESVKKQIDKIDEMSDELKSFTKAREVNATNTNILELFEEVKRDLSNYAKPKNTNLINRSKTCIFARVDGNKLLRAINNMALNSLQAISHLEGSIEFNSTAINNDLVITISDNGCGIAKEHLSRVFDSSFTHGKVKGTGLGLAYCKNVAEAHGGTIEVKSEQGNGATFTMKLPGVIISEGPLTDSSTDVVAAHKEGEPVAENKFSVIRSNHHGKKPWILVEDTETFREQWKEIFASNGIPAPIEYLLPEQVLKSSLTGNDVAGAIVDLNYAGTVMTGFDAIELLQYRGVKNIHLCTSDYNEEKVKKEADLRKISSIIPKPIPENVSAIIGTSLPS